MDDLMTKVAALQGRIDQCEKEALDHEQQARALRAERQECKVKLGEVQAAVNQAVSQQATQNAANAAKAAQAAAEAAKTESVALLDTLKAKSAELDALLAKAKEEKPAE